MAKIPSNFKLEPLLGTCDLVWNPVHLSDVFMFISTAEKRAEEKSLCPSLAAEDVKMIILYTQ